MAGRIRFVLAIGCALAAFQAVAPADAAITQAPNAALTPSLAPMLQKVLPGVVSIGVRGSVAIKNPLLSDPMFQQFFGNRQQGQTLQQQFQALGSGVIVDAQNGYVLTNDHVVENANSIRVGLSDGREFQGKVVGSDQPTDLAVVKIDANNLTAVPMDDSSKLRVGDYVMAVGNPFGLSQTVTMGIVSALGRTGLGIEGFEDFIQTDASINPGNSGGALVDINGGLVGINSAILGSSGNIGIGFAIPSNMARDVMQQLVATGKVARGQLGVNVLTVTPSIASAQHIPVDRGALVAQVQNGSPAQKAGIQKGDVITAVNGKPMQTGAALRVTIGLTKPGTMVDITLNRNGSTQTVSPVLAEAQPIAQKASITQ
jgi:serine protease DegQ